MVVFHSAGSLLQSSKSLKKKKRKGLAPFPLPPHCLFWFGFSSGRLGARRAGGGQPCERGSGSEGCPMAFSSLLGVWGGHGAAVRILVLAVGWGLVHSFGSLRGNPSWAFLLTQTLIHVPPSAPAPWLLSSAPTDHTEILAGAATPQKYCCFFPLCRVGDESSGEVEAPFTPWGCG